MSHIRFARSPHLLRRTRMHGDELSELAIAPARSDADLEAMIDVRRRRRRRRGRQSRTFATTSSRTSSRLSGRADRRRAGRLRVRRGVREHRRGDVSVVRAAPTSPAASGRPWLGEVRRDARACSGRESLQGEVRRDRRRARARSSSAAVPCRSGRRRALVLELERLERAGDRPPAGLRIVSRVEEPGLLGAHVRRRGPGGRGRPGLDRQADVEPWRA